MKHPIDFECLCFPCYMSWGIFNISLLISLLTHWFFLVACCLISTQSDFSYFFLWLFSSFMSLWSEKMLEIISIFLNLVRLVCAPVCGQSLIMFNVHLKRMYILFCPGFVFFGCNVLKTSTNSNFSIVSFGISVTLLIFCLEDLSIDVSGVLKSLL